MTNPDRLADATGGRGGRAAGVPSNPKTEGSPGKLAGPNGVPAAVANHPIPATAGDTAARVSRADVGLSSQTPPAGHCTQPMPAGALEILLTLPPTSNKLWVPVRTRYGSRMVKRAASSEWAAAAARDVARQAGPVIAGPFHAAIILPVTRADIDGRIKPILDALQAGGAIVNDRLCKRLVVEVDASREGTALVRLTPIPPQPHAPARTKGHARKEPTT